MFPPGLEIAIHVSHPDMLTASNTNNRIFACNNINHAGGISAGMQKQVNHTGLFSSSCCTCAYLIGGLGISNLAAATSVYHKFCVGNSPPPPR